MKTLPTLLLLAVALAPGCGAGDCPDMSGEWTVTRHCQANYVGQTFTVTRETAAFGETPTCGFNTRLDGDYFEGHFWPDGTVSMAGRAGGGTIGCSGTGDGDAINLSCDDDCVVELARAGEGGGPAPTPTPTPTPSNCPDIGGTWHYEQVCAPSDTYFEPGETQSITQNGCSLSFTDTVGFRWTGSISSSGQVTVSTDFIGDTLSCSGPSDASRIDLSCDLNLCGGSPSKVVFTRSQKQRSGGF